jgi:glycosyltransferase involved in cell wall biosynthesis
VKLVVIHYHFRPGGVRRVIELATPHLLRAANSRFAEVVLVGGEAPDERWQRHFEDQVAPVPVTGSYDHALGYWSEQRPHAESIRRRIRAVLEPLLSSGADCVVWAHNQSLGRNLILTAELQRLCAERRVKLVLHHHDWWFDNRWQRWAEMRASGFRTLDAVAETILGTAPNVRHAGINRMDARILEAHAGRQAGWLPNPAAASVTVSTPQLQRAREWLAAKSGENGPVWLMPCRLLRRKNVAEALLLARWLRPSAWLITTGDISSAEEKACAAALERAARKQGWRLRLSVLAGSEQNTPPIPDLMAGSEVVLLTSLQEGFGLPYLEAAAAGRPLLARALPNIMPDLRRFGFRFPHLYADLLVAPSLFNWERERRHQQRLFSQWRARIPSSRQGLAGVPWLLRTEPAPVPFSRLTLTAQLEVLAGPVEESWQACAELNPFLVHWKELAGQGKLAPAEWPAKAAQFLSGEAYARKWYGLLAERNARPAPAAAAVQAQDQFIRERLATENLYPLTWNTKT